MAEEALAAAARDQPAEHGEIGRSQQTNRPSQHYEAAVQVRLEVVEALDDAVEAVVDVFLEVAEAPPEGFLALLEGGVAVDDRGLRFRGDRGRSIAGLEGSCRRRNDGGALAAAAPHFRHTRACRGYLAVVRATPRSRLPAFVQVGEEGRGLGAGGGEIPAASAGMTDLICAGVTDVGRGCGGGGKRGYDGEGVRLWRRGPSRRRARSASRAWRGWTQPADQPPKSAS